MSRSSSSQNESFQLFDPPCSPDSPSVPSTPYRVSMEDDPERRLLDDRLTRSLPPTPPETALLSSDRLPLKESDIAERFANRRRSLSRSPFEPAANSHTIEREPSPLPYTTFSASASPLYKTAVLQSQYQTEHKNYPRPPIKSYTILKSDEQNSTLAIGPGNANRLSSDAYDLYEYTPKTVEHPPPLTPAFTPAHPSPLADTYTDSAYLISFGQEDPRHPFNWTILKKWTSLLVVCSGALCVTVASSIQASTYGNLVDEFGVPRTEAVAGVSLYVLGFGVGALFLGPMSEFYGRRNIYLVSFILFTVFNIPIATAQNMAVLLIFRLITGLCGAGFLAVAGGTVTDLFVAGTTDLPTAIYTLSPLAGPCLGPIIGGFLNQEETWRATFYLIIGWSALECVLLWFLVPETFLPVILKEEAEKERRRTGQGLWYSPADRSARGLRDVFPGVLWIPIKMMAVEKMALALDLWTSLILGIIYLFFNAIPFTFGTVYGFSLGETGIAFIPLGLGMVVGTATQPFFIRAIKDSAIVSGGKASPEARLPVGMAGAILVPLGLLWFALSSFPQMPWIMPMIGTSIFGVGAVYVFTCVFSFLVSTYPKYAASAMAGNTLLRCVWAAGFPLFATPLYQALGPQGATGLLAGTTVIMAPIPFVLSRMGPTLRARSKYSS